MYGEGATMSRRKQLNPKPLLINDFQCSVDEIEKEIEKPEEASSNYDLDLGLEPKREPDSNTKSPLPTNNTDDNVSYSSLGDLISEHQKLPKLRLNVSLASDPALQPEAKDLRLGNRDAPLDKNLYDDAQNSDAIQRVKVFMCHPCGIGFSSLSTLEAHQAYYCSHRNDKDEGDKSIPNVIEKIPSGEPSTKSIKTGRQYACNQCSYSADKKVSLNRHMRMHQTSPGSASNTSTIDNNYNTQIDRYCSECDIRFSNAKTFNAHKQHYCHSRRIDNQGTSQTALDVEKIKWKTPPLRTSALASVQPFLALPTNPILIIPYSLLRMATFLPGSMSALTGEVENSHSTCFVYENGTVRPLAVASTSSNNAHETLQIFIDSNTDFSGSPPSVLTERNSKVTNVQGPKLLLDDSYSKETAPLDLSLRKFANDGIFEEKENVSSQIDVNTPTHIICAPSPLNSPSPIIPPSMEEASPFVINLPISPSVLSPPRNSVSDKPSESKEAPETKQATESNQASEPSATRTSILEVDHEANNLSSSANLLCPSISAISNPSPQIYVKQGVSKCKECNIVFCKYENYLAHKQHYCSSRLKEDSRRNASNTSPSNSIPQSVAYQQLICAACGIKYTSLDNLRAHQSFYCPKGNELTASLAICKEKCLKCNVVHESGHCSISQDAFKCPVCDTVSSSAIESKRHFESHGSIKAFRCSICRYKGNTLRGMRSHIRLHFDKKGMDLNEENYMMCIMEDEPLVVDATYPETSNAESDLQLQLYNCDVCSYSSSYKGNVVRHMKLIHSLPSEAATGSSGKENDSSKNNEAEDLSKDGSSVSNIDCTDAKSEKISETISIKTEEEATSHNKRPPSFESALSYDNSRKYCQACDIKFKYLNSYLAHKQFYCNRTDNDANDFFLDSNQLHSSCDSSKTNLETVL